MTQGFTAAAGAVLIDSVDGRIAGHYGDVLAEYRALTEDVALVDRSHRGRLEASDDDRLNFFHAMASNEVRDLPPGHGNRTLFCDKTGHVLASGALYHCTESLLLDVDGSTTQRLFDWLEKHIIGDWVELADRSTMLACYSLQGPGSTERLAEVWSSGLPPEPMGIVELDGVYLARVVDELGPRYDLFLPREAAGEWWSRLAALARPTGRQALELREVELGVPRYGVDVSERNLPQEAGLDHHLSYTKGCYLGQETIARLHYRGRPARHLRGLLLGSGDPVAAGTPLLVQDKEVGHITRSVVSPMLDAPIALSYVKRAHAEAGTVVQVGGREATVVVPPFQG